MLPAGRARALAGVVGGYALLALVATWPLAVHVSTSVPGLRAWEGRNLFFESPVNLWNLWWFRHALVDLGVSPFHTPLLFHPHGADLWTHTLAPLHGVAGVLLQSFLSLAAAQNVILLLDLVAAGTATFLLARHLGLEPAAAFLAGAVHAFSPAVFAHLWVGHFELLATWAMPAALLCFLRLTAPPRPHLADAVALALVLLGAVYTSPYYALYSGELLVVAALVCGRRLWRREVLWRLGAGALAVLVGAAPMALALARERAAPVPGDFARYSGDLVGFVVPSFASSFLAGPFRELNLELRPHPLDFPQETTTYLGVSLLGLALWALWRRRTGPLAPPAIRLLVSSVLVFGLLALGSELHVLGARTGVPLPAAWLHSLPLFSQARAPGRHVVVVMLGLGILAAAGWQAIGTRRSGDSPESPRQWPRRLRPCLRWGLVALVAADLAALPVPLFSTATPAVYERLRAAPGEFAVLELPLGLRDGTVELGRQDPAQIFAQTRHHRPLVAGMVSRLPDATWQAILAAPVVSTLLHPRGATQEAWERDRREGPAYFARWGIRAVVVHPAERGGRAQRYVEAVLPISARELFPDGTELLWVGDARP